MKKKFNGERIVNEYEVGDVVNTNDIIKESGGGFTLMPEHESKVNDFVIWMYAFLLENETPPIPEQLCNLVGDIISYKLKLLNEEGGLEKLSNPEY